MSAHPTLVYARAKSVADIEPVDDESISPLSAVARLTGRAAIVGIEVLPTVVGYAVASKRFEHKLRKEYPTFFTDKSKYLPLNPWLRRKTPKRITEYAQDLVNDHV